VRGYLSHHVIVILSVSEGSFYVKQWSAVACYDLALHLQHPVSSRARYAIHAPL